MKKLFYFRLLLAVLAVVMLCITVSCATVGHQFDESQVQKIQIGKTTSADIMQMFGKPWRTGVDDGVRTWTYGLYKYGALKGTQSSDLVVRFDDQGVVSSYTYNTSDGAKK